MAEPANPRVENLYGHILEMIPPRAADGRPDHTATNGRWEIFLLAGDPRQPSDKAHYHPGVSADGWLTCPDNLVCDPQGRLWIATDGMDGVGIADGIYGADTAGEGRALTRHFFACPRGAEACGPEFTPDGSTLFVAVQHPGNDANSTFDRPSTRWPDFDPALPPRPSVVAITRR
jgi:secreted PhoX family phosphatase